MWAVGSRPRRLAEVTILVGAWIAISLIFQLSANLHLLLGIPLVLGFQLFVRRRPIADLWVRDAPRVPIDRKTIAIGIILVLLAYPALTTQVAAGAPAWYMPFAIGLYTAGAVGATYAARALRVDRRTWVYIGVATGLGLAWMLLNALTEGTPKAEHVGDFLARATGMLAYYLSIGFVVEEVAFRGLIDAHVHHPGDDRQWQSALFVSCLWGVWHLPVVIGFVPAVLIPVALFVPHILEGIPLSFAWRRGGNLALPVGAHAVIDAVRDGLAVLI
jgi:hypothetical protein